MGSSLKKLDDKYNINTGGCIYVAYLIAKNLEKLGIHYEVIDWKDPDNNEVFHISLNYPPPKVSGILWSSSQNLLPASLNILHL